MQAGARAVFAIFGELREEPLLEDQGVTVRFDAGRLVLAGTVWSPAARDRALEIARAHAGPFPVVDSLRVADPGPRRPAEGEVR